MYVLEKVQYLCLKNKSQIYLKRNASLGILGALGGAMRPDQEMAEWAREAHPKT